MNSIAVMRSVTTESCRCGRWTRTLPAPWCARGGGTALRTPSSTLTKDRELAVVDLQIRQLFDPRGRIEVHVSTANATTLPYLTECILHDLMARQDWFGDHVVIKRDEQLYAKRHIPSAPNASWNTATADPTATTERRHRTGRQSPGCSGDGPFMGRPMQTCGRRSGIASASDGLVRRRMSGDCLAQWSKMEPWHGTRARSF
jgi:hypothetical protein